MNEFLGINWRTVSKYLKMSEEEFLSYIEAQSNRQKLLAPFEGFVKIKLEKYPDTKAAQMHDWLKESGEAQVSTSDPDSRQMIIRNNITEVAYNIQTSVDAKNKMLIDCKEPRAYCAPMSLLLFTIKAIIQDQSLR